MKLKALSSSVLLALLPISGVYAAAMDRSGQSISAFLQPNNYFEAGISVLDPNVSGKALPAYGGGNISNMADDYYFPSAAIKLQPTENFSVGLLYDQPFGAKTTYQGNNAFVGNQIYGPTGPTPLTHNSDISATQADVKSQNLSLIFGFQPNENINLYAGAAYQTIKGSVSLRGPATSVLNGYDAILKEDDSFGWLVGAAYQIPEIALKASLTYRSEIDHDLNTRENLPQTAQFGPLAPLVNGVFDSSLAKTGITTPQSVNLDFQTGIMADTVAFANVRWVNWESVSIQPDKFGQLSRLLGQNGLVAGKPNGFNLLEYSKDQWSANLGVGRKLTEKWSGTVSVGWDSGAGNPVTALGPTEGYWNVGLGAQFSPAPNYFIAGGVKYFWLGDAKGQLASQSGTNAYVADFEDNYALAYGLKIGYKF